MNKFEVLSVALDYIEENLTDKLNPEDCANVCGYSLSSLQKTFRCVFNIGISDYISRRRLSHAARELIDTEQTVLDVALKYGYNSHEVFTRAFIRLWGVSPSVFRRERRFSDIFPKLGETARITDNEGNEIMYSKKKFDISHLYDFLMARRGKYAICFDMVRLMYINETYGSAAGDIAIAEGLKRIDMESDETMLTIRIGGDEFVLITDYDTETEAQAMGEKILAHNGETVKSGNHEFEVSMRAGLVVIPTGNIRYNELFGEFINASR